MQASIHACIYVDACMYIDRYIDIYSKYIYIYIYIYIYMVITVTVKSAHTVMMYFVQEEKLSKAEEVR